MPVSVTRFAAYAGANESLLSSQASDVLNCYKNACMGNVLHRLIWMKFMSMLSMYAQFGTFMYENYYYGFNTKSCCCDVWGYHRGLKLLGICINMSICCGFRAVAAMGKISGVHVIMYLLRKITSSYIGVEYLLRRTNQPLRRTSWLIHSFYLLMRTKANSYVVS